MKKKRVEAKRKKEAKERERAKEGERGQDPFSETPRKNPEL